MNNRIVLFGGSFDPPHIAHLLVAQWAAELFSCKVRLLPNGRPPHKNPSSTEDHRAVMLKLAAGDNPDLIIDETELQSNVVNYTVDTLRYYQSKYCVDKDNLFFILGSDSFNSLEAWRNPRAVSELCTLVVFKREPLSEAVFERLKSQGASIIVADAPVLGISSGMIRERVMQGKSIQYFVPDKVREYILKLDLYKEGKKPVAVEGKEY